MFLGQRTVALFIKQKHRWHNTNWYNETWIKFSDSFPHFCNFRFALAAKGCLTITPSSSLRWTLRAPSHRWLDIISSQAVQGRISPIIFSALQLASIHETTNANKQISMYCPPLLNENQSLIHDSFSNAAGCNNFFTNMSSNKKRQN